VYPSVIPHIGDVLRSVYNDHFYQITEVKEEIGMYLLSKQHVWEFIVKPYYDTHIGLSATTSATAISAVTDRQTDIFDATSAVGVLKPPVMYQPKPGEQNPNDPWNAAGY
jgi:carbohydrate-binding DOMON domain-containing protein